MTTATGVKYETKSVKAVRGLEARTRAKLEKEGWEFVAQEQGTVMSELTFRRPRPEIPWKLIGAGGGLLALLIVGSLIISAVGGGDSSNNSAEALPSPAPSQIVETEARTLPAEATAPSIESPPAAPVVVAITVDELLDKLNSAQMGGIKNGDQFGLTGELFMSKLWMTGAAGEFTVMLKAKGGAQDLSVFVEQSDAAGWRDGTKVQMVLEAEEATINGETTGGWLRAVSVDTIP
ncbi:hypothetical protein [Pseudarthrobacter sp. PS3-L1]|uniref:hypothetical protein n=1 Tax=Pseudarthrobacter sp. PS3-L1 TaxID=3046207 RepID=UPI0024BB589B|nr:hypothetical protein [Pseudarthrobacter sp. PS3-L1]MDJ0319994.1 hypothetical protein [Pseudarthrobacter sp. PS3-L1]